MNGAQLPRELPDGKQAAEHMPQTVRQEQIR
jgi:hypothetical protein